MILSIPHNIVMDLNNFMYVRMLLSLLFKIDVANICDNY